MGDSIWDSGLPVRQFRCGRLRGFTNVPEPTPEQIAESLAWVDSTVRKMTYNRPKIIRLSDELTVEDLGLDKE